jgi:hypothetical protein
MAYSSYNVKSDWSLETFGGVSGSKGIGSFFSAGVQRINFGAKYVNLSNHKHKTVDLAANLSGFDVGIGIGKDLLEELAGMSLEYLKASETRNRFI